MEEEHQEQSTDSTAIYNLIILDESGSMEEIRKETISGFNEVVQTIVSTQLEFKRQKNYVTFVSFNTMGIRTHLSMVPVEEFKQITAKDYQPNAGTPLLDAVGFSCTRLRHELTDKNDYKVLVTILTDGYENASREYTGTMIKNLIDEMKSEGWIFTFIGANIDVESVAQSMSINNSMSFAKDPAAMKIMFEKEKLSRKAFHSKIDRKIQNLDNFYDEEDKEDKESKK